MDWHDAGEFSVWLKEFRNALLGNGPSEVPCGSCNACCTSSMFIRIQSSEIKSINSISNDALSKNSDGDFILSPDAKGHCSQYSDNHCGVYESRPLTCRQYDCRIYTAAGLVPDEKAKSKIAKRVNQWKFAYASKKSLELHHAVKDTASFILKHQTYFPGKRIPSDPIQIALVAIKSYESLLKRETDLKAVAESIVQKNEEFELQRLLIARK